MLQLNTNIIIVAAVPPDCKDLKVGDRVLEINGVQAFNFGSAKKANELFDTVCMVFLPKEELIRKKNGKKKYGDDDGTSSEEETDSRIGRRSMYEEEARRAGAQRMSLRNLAETLRKEKEEEAELRIMEREIRQLQRADRERRADQERRRSRILEIALPSGGLNGAVANGTGQRPSILFSPPQTSNKRTLRSSIMESITRSPSTSDRKLRSSMIDVKKSLSTSDRKRSQIRSSGSIPPTPVTTAEQPKELKTPKEPKTPKGSKPKEQKPASVAPAPSTSESSTSEQPTKAKEQKEKDPKPANLSPTPSETSPVPIEPEVPKKSKLREPMSPNANSAAPAMPKRRSSVVVEKKVRELERAARARNGGMLSPAPLSPEETMKPKVKFKVGKLGNKSGSKKWSKSSPKNKPTDVSKGY